ncbi:hypothetical protein LFT44_07765 [Arthrobacter sp. FW306-05-C]|uniref:hypothetical protein n=1 Tax=Arthrobacter TaxID=1663 RepID=UPI001EF15BE7|nr:MULTISPECIES: hypothetical protein [Arthrobacter]MDP9987230.1 hypothetical protein [Arthrobacter oryzae]UKA68283.1 hypothetical protein LFT44_07765 [Arthrobacter sp. FW306-05-C]UKA72811.1 hypothetical protein LFT49_08845 [Arthrobacter sp. FW306-06-A]UKA77042.1 hypothetical protein LFT46_08410 [Arthrobacter sp. FW306-07-I]
MREFIGALPQPLKSLYLVFFLVFIVNMIAVAFKLVEYVRWTSGSMGVVLFLLGLCVIANINGAASGLVEGIKNYHPFGVDYSKSLLASMFFVRVFGVMALVVGAGFFYLGFFAPGFSLS